MKVIKNNVDIYQELVNCIEDVESVDNLLYKYLIKVATKKQVKYFIDSKKIQKLFYSEYRREYYYKEDSTIFIVPEDFLSEKKIKNINLKNKKFGNFFKKNNVNVEEVSSTNIRYKNNKSSINAIEKLKKELLDENKKLIERNNTLKEKNNIDFKKYEEKITKLKETVLIGERIISKLNNEKARIEVEIEGKLNKKKQLTRNAESNHLIQKDNQQIVDLKKEKELHLEKIETLNGEKKLHLEKIETLKEEKELHLEKIETLKEEKELHLEKIETLKEEKELHLEKIKKENHHTQINNNQIVYLQNEKKILIGKIDNQNLKLKQMTCKLDELRSKNNELILEYNLVQADYNNVKKEKIILEDVKKINEEKDTKIKKITENNETEFNNNKISETLKFDRYSDEYIDEALLNILKMYELHNQLQVETIYRKLPSEYRQILNKKINMQYLIKSYPYFKELPINEVKRCIENDYDIKKYIFVYHTNEYEKELSENIPKSYLNNLYINENLKEAIFDLPEKEKEVLLYRNGLYDYNYMALRSKTIDLKKIRKSLIEGSISCDEIKDKIYESNWINQKEKEKIGNRIDLNNKNYEKKYADFISFSEKLDKKSINRTSKISKGLEDIKEDNIEYLENICIILENQIKVREKVEKLNEGSIRSLTLEEVGKIFDVSRERIRQIEAKGQVKLLAYIKSNSLDKEFDSENLMGLSQLFINILYFDKQITSKNFNWEKEINYSYNINNEFIKNRYLPENYYVYYNSIVPSINRELLEKYLELNVCETTHIDEIEIGYINSIKEQGIFERQNKKDPVNEREIEGLLERNLKVIKSINHSYRYWRGDFEKLKVYLDEKTENLENFFSTNFIFSDELIYEYDVMDYYELHNIMKKYEYKMDDFTYLRTPHISQFGEDYIDYLYYRFKKFFGDNYEFCKFISKKTGIKEDTILANYIPKLSEKYITEEYTYEELKKYENLELGIEKELLNIEEITDDKFVKYLKYKSEKFNVSGTWVLNNKYANFVDYLRQNTVNEIFEESKLKHYTLFENYERTKVSIRKKRIYFQFDKGYLISVENIKENLEKLDKFLLEKFNFPISTKKLIMNEKFIECIKLAGLDDYENYEDVFWIDYLSSNKLLQLSTDRKKVFNGNFEIDYKIIFEDNIKMNIYDFEEKFINYYGFELSNSMKENLCIKGSFIYISKKTYLEELKKQAMENNEN